MGVPPRLETYRRCNTKTRFKRVTHCIFDLDGTILDSEKQYHKIVEELCARYGKKYTREMEQRMIGGTDEDVCRAIIRELQLKLTVDQCKQELDEMSAQILPKAPLLKGVERLLLHLKANNIPFALATNSNEHTLRLHIKAKPKLFSLFHHMVNVEDPEIDRGKPHPDIFLVTASRFTGHPKPAQCLVFEDSGVGVEAAIQAGMQVIMIPPRSALSGYRVIVNRATQVLPSLYEFKPEHFGLPPFNDNISRNSMKRNVYISKTKLYFA